MKSNYFLLAFLLCSVFFGCHEPSKTPASNAPLVKDIRPKEQIYFLNRVKADSHTFTYANALQTDNLIKAFNKYAIDSLKEIQSWEMIVSEINDDEYDASSFAKGMSMTDYPFYNLKLAAPVKIDKSVDTTASDDRVDFVYTILKDPKGEELKKQLSIMQTLHEGDTVLVSGSITHLNDELKIDFTDVFQSFLPWKIDLLINDIKKKGAK